MKVLRRLRNRIVWQRVPVDELLIRRPAREAATATIYAFLFVLAAVLTGVLIRWKPMIEAHRGVDVLPAIISFLGIDY